MSPFTATTQSHANHQVSSTPLGLNRVSLFQCAGIYPGETLPSLVYPTPRQWPPSSPTPTPSRSHSSPSVWLRTPHPTPHFRYTCGPSTWMLLLLSSPIMAGIKCITYMIQTKVTTVIFIFDFPNLLFCETRGHTMFKIMTGQYCNIIIVLLQSFNVFYLLIFSDLYPDYNFFNIIVSIAT